MTERGLVKTTLDLEEGPLDERLLAVQELYDFSAASGYRIGKPDGEDDVATGGGGRNDAVRGAWRWERSGDPRGRGALSLLCGSFILFL